MISFIQLPILAVCFFLLLAMRRFWICIDKMGFLREVGRRAPALVHTDILVASLAFLPFVIAAVDWFFVSESRTIRFWISICERRRLAISEARMPVAKAIWTIHPSMGLLCLFTAANRRFSSSAMRRLFRPSPGLGLRILSTGLKVNPSPHS